MPLYDYECTKCKSKKEVFEKWDATEERFCSECNEKMNRIYTKTAKVIMDLNVEPMYFHEEMRGMTEYK